MAAGRVFAGVGDGVEMLALLLFLALREMGMGEEVLICEDIIKLFRL